MVSEEFKLDISFIIIIIIIWICVGLLIWLL